MLRGCGDHEESARPHHRRVARVHRCLRHGTVDRVLPRRVRMEQLFDERMEGRRSKRLTHFPGAAGRAYSGRIGSLRVELMQFNFIPDVPAPSGLGLPVLSIKPTRTRPTPSWCATSIPCPARRSRCSACACSSSSIPTAGHRDVRVRPQWPHVGRCVPVTEAMPRSPTRRHSSTMATCVCTCSTTGTRSRRSPPCWPSREWGSTPTSTRGCSTCWATAVSSWSTCGRGRSDVPETWLHLGAPHRRPPRGRQALGPRRPIVVALLAVAAPTGSGTR